ncbi:MAG: hypothetical protein ACTSRP_00845 [Candidatus Helarchaeota archaeon]
MSDSKIFSDINLKKGPKLVIKNNAIYIITHLPASTFNPAIIKNAFYYTIANNIKNCLFIIDFESNEYKTKVSTTEINKNLIHFSEELIRKIIVDVNFNNINRESLILGSLCRYRKKYEYIDHFLIRDLNNNYYLLSTIHLAQFIEFEDVPKFHKGMLFHKKLIINIRKKNCINLNDVHFTFLYGRSYPIGFMCIGIGTFIIIFSILQVINFWNIIFGIFAILLGISWLVPIK